MIHVDVPDTNIEAVLRVFRLAHTAIEIKPFVSEGKRFWTVIVTDVNRNLLERAYTVRGQVTGSMLETVRAHLDAEPTRKNDAVRFLRNATGWSLAETVNYVNSL